MSDEVERPSENHGEPSRHEKPSEAALHKPPLVATPCPGCGGGGRVVLFTSSRPCQRCGGVGRINPNPGVLIEGPAGTFHAYDEQGRLIHRTEPNAVVVRTYVYEQE